MPNAINWFEIPAADFDRAVKFYSAIFGQQMHTTEAMGTKMAFFNADKGVGGAICQGENYEPSTKGTVPYLNGGDDLSTALNKVEKAGGKIVVPKTRVSDDVGHIAYFMDTEGNKIGLNSKG